jgi:hypothetical protein
MNEDIKYITVYAASKILGKSSNIILEGSKESILIINEAIDSSKNLYDVLRGDNSSMKDVQVCLDQKKKATHKFKKKFGMPWPL